LVRQPADIAYQRTIAVVTVAGDRLIRLRDLCAAIGDLEEAARGTTCAALGIYAKNHLRWDYVVVEQGVEMGRSSEIHVVAAEHRATVSGRARLVMQGGLAASMLDATTGQT